ncbi:tRNA (adenosine(37)-N6)-threonylcarbamoyltransferase complex ATPase subunit type 1 TsaE [Mycoplasma sp. P36-A1]|uniref:tRNA (adenosine(37)-N6)-threonylcarbamoyltransferase complex ATPase subunit type 1 TsaE n=1 Tax=Mycoplasma sp. P36-A1 TaxID=3252900 RepID=UPI003C2DE4E5
MKLELILSSLDETALFAKKIASVVSKSKGVIFLDGDLGAGKTTFTKLLAKNLGINEIVTSPTFNIFKRYEFNSSALNHFDLYRIKENVYDNGFEDYWFDPNEISIIEWSTFLPEEFQDICLLKLNIEIIGDNKRKIIIHASDKILDIIKELN